MWIPTLTILTTTILFMVMYVIELDSNIQKINFAFITGLLPAVGFYAILNYLFNTALSPTSSSYITSSASIEPSLIFLFIVLPVPSATAFFYPFFGAHAFWLGPALGGLFTFSGIYNLSSLLKIVASYLGTGTTSGAPAAPATGAGRTLRSVMMHRH